MARVPHDNLTNSVRLNINNVPNVLGCGAGYYSVYPNATGCECKICPIGTHNNRDSAASCTSCPPGWTTLQTGTTGSWYCRQGDKYDNFLLRILYSDTY